MKSLLNKAACREYALEQSKQQRNGRFKRVGKDFFDELESLVRSQGASGTIERSHTMSQEIQRAVRIFTDARSLPNTSASEAELLTRNILVLQGVCEPYASRYAKAARSAEERKDTR